MGVRRAFGLALALVACSLTRPVATAPEPLAVEEAGPRAAEQVAARSSFGLAPVDAACGYLQRALPGLGAAYGATTAPVSIVEGGEVPVEVRVTNTGSETWRAAGPDAVRLSYHWYDGDGAVVAWDGPRADLAADVRPGRIATFSIPVRAPRASGAFFLDWDLVQEGTGWLSARGIPMKTERVAVGDGVALYGKGWGHGIGLSQWDAQGWAEGASGVRLTGEQIVRHYFPGAALSSHPASRPIRVLLSAPSTACVARTIEDVALMWSAGGMRLVDDADPTVVYADVGPYGLVSFWADGGDVVAWDDSSGRILVRGPGAVTLVPTQWWDPIAVQRKGLSYRGNLRVSARDEGYLRVVNYVPSDDYMKGALPGEMPEYWQPEALRAQAITARTYAAWRQATAGDRTTCGTRHRLR